MKAKPLIRKPKEKGIGNKKTFQCVACNRYCTIPPGQVGFCGVRANDNGKFNLMVYGKPCAVWIDPIEKKPMFHFLPGSKSYSLGTFGCDFACSFCQNWDISQAPHEARFRDPKGWRNYFERLIEKSKITLPPDLVVEKALESGCKSISFTYNEPTIFTEYALDVIDAAKERGADLKFVYVTNGYETPECWNALKGKLDAANIDLKAYNQDFYGKLCKANLEPVKESIKLAKKAGIWVEVTTLIIPGENDKIKELQAEAKFLASIDKDMPWHVTAFHPEYKMLDKEPTGVEILIKAREIGKAAGIKHVYAGNIPQTNSNLEATHCPNPKCGKVAIERIGFSVTLNNLIDGKCRFCKEKIKGIWK
jgi:pyruvate formate lyase activating enzyme